MTQRSGSSTAAPPIPIAVLASGRGTGFEAIASAIREGSLDARIVALVCDRPGAPVIAKAQAAGIPQLVIPSVGPSIGPSAGPSVGPSIADREEHDRQVIEALRPFSPRFLVMAGYMRVVSSRLIETFRSEKGYTRITNVHPSVLPAFPGVKAYAQAFRFGCKVAGVTVHLVEETVDSGPICAQETFSIRDCRSEREVEELGLRIEHRLYPETLGWILPERFEMENRGGRLCVRPN